MMKVLAGAMSDKPDYTTLVKQPGDDGTLWRLLDLWRLENVHKWLKGEQLRATGAMTLGPVFGRALAIATMTAAEPFSDREAFIANERTGVVSAYGRYLKLLADKAGANKTKGGIIVPPPGLH